VTNHSTPSGIGEKIRDVSRIVLTHFYPESIGHENEMAAQVAEMTGSKAEAGYDLMEITI
jgi:ribonuclease BN (tRNA processing enzyme)